MCSCHPLFASFASAYDLFSDEQGRPTILPNACYSLISDLSRVSLDFPKGNSEGPNLCSHLVTDYMGSLHHRFLMTLGHDPKKILGHSFAWYSMENETHISSSHDISAS